MDNMDKILLTSKIKLANKVLAEQILSLCQVLSHCIDSDKREEIRKVGIEIIDNIWKEKKLNIPEQIVCLGTILVSILGIVNDNIEKKG